MQIKTAYTLLALCLTLSTQAIARDEHQPEIEPGVSPIESTAPTTKPSPSSNVKSLETNAAKLHTQASRIVKAKPGPERDKLVSEHMHSLHESMEIVKSIMPGMAVEHCKHASETGADHKHMEMMEQMMKGGKANH